MKANTQGKKSEFNVQLYITNKNLQTILENLPCRKQKKVRGKLNSYVNNEIYKLCSEHILPNLAKYQKNHTVKVQRRFVIKDMAISDSRRKDKHTNLELLHIFSNYHKISIAKIVSLYILFPFLLSEKKK